MNLNSIALLLLVATYSATNSHANESSKRPSDTRTLAAVSTEETPAERPAAAQKYGPTKEGETLEHVVQLVLTDATLSNEQMMWALYTANPKAFEGGKLSRLRTGAYLTVPTPEQVRRIDSKVAHREIESRTVRPTAKPSVPKQPLKAKAKAGDVDSQIEEAKRERDEVAKEQVFLKARLKEMEDKIQTLLRENAERDAKLRAQSTTPRK
jgi:pilus assembly protein FimV